MNDACVLSGTPTLPAGRVALTYDDGPGPRSAELARLLRDEEVPATFFVLGESIRRYGEVLAEIADCGHTIGLHSEFHRPFTSILLAKDQLDKCRRRVEQHLGEDYFTDKPIWYRPPYGVGDEPVPGYSGPVGWHASGRDWDVTYRNDAALRPPIDPRPVQTVEGCVSDILAGLRRADGGVVLLHDFAPRTEYTAGGMEESDLDLQAVEITVLLLQRLRAAGFELVGLPEQQPAA